MSTVVGARHVAALRLVRDVGLTGAVVVSWATAGGVLFGGAVAGLLLHDPSRDMSSAFLHSTGWFALGALIGLVHGAALGVLGRRPWLTIDRAWTAVGIATLYSLPALATVWTTAAWMALTPRLWARGDAVGYLGSVVGWGIGALVVTLALIHGSRALREAYRRWPERVPGTIFAAAAFLGLLIELTSVAPRIFWVPVRFDLLPAIVTAAVLSTWIIGPAVTVGLRLRVRFRPRVCLRIAGEGRIQRAWSVAAVVPAAVLLAAVALPFHGAPYYVPTPLEGLSLPAGMLRAGGEVILFGVVFRLFLVTVILAAVTRTGRADNLRAVLAVVGAAVVESAALVPGAIAVGLPGTASTVGFVLAMGSIPALVLGFLYLRAGWSLSLVAHALSVVLVGLLVGGVR